MRKKSKKEKPDVWKRRVTYKLYPTKAQRLVLESWLPLHCELYNAAIEERREAWKTAKVSIGYVSQQNQLPEIKELRPELIPLGSHALQSTLNRVNEAYAGFFRRLKGGETPGYPRFKSRHRYKGWTWPDPAGWKLVASRKSRKASIVVPTLGEIRARGRARLPGRPVSCTVTKKTDGWYASIALDVRKPEIFEKPVRKNGTEHVGFDWGLSSFLAFDDGATIKNPRFLGDEIPQLKNLSKDLSRKRKGSKNWRKAVKKLSSFHRKIEWKREDFQHKESATLVARTAFLAAEELDTKALVEKKDQSRGRRRAILDSAPAGFLQKVRYKAEEAGIGYVEVPTKVVKPSQRCPECFQLCGKKPLWQRKHECPHCGYQGPRDQSSAKVCLLWAEGKRPTGWGPASTVEGIASKEPLGSRKPRANREAVARG